jgi:hypothetical protein
MMLNACALEADQHLVLRAEGCREVEENGEF